MEYGLQRYAPLFLEEAEAELAAVPLQWEIVRREFRAETSGDTATVFVEALGIEGVVEGDAFSFEFAGDCIRAEAAGESFEQCNTGAFDDELGLLDGAPEVQRLIDTITDAFSDMEAVGLEMRRTDDLWYVSPVSTGTEGVLALLRALDRAELDAIIEQAPAAVDELADAFFSGFNDLPADFGVIEDSASAELDSGTSGGIDIDPGATTDVAGGETCYSEVDPVAAQACFADEVAAGVIDPTFVPVVLRHPECGYTVAWGGSLYNLSDEEFTAAAEAARPCFLDLVDQGVLDEFELPTEIAFLDCFEGRNWYNVFDDPEYDDRYYACLEAGYAN